jgi:hypothetical protein
VELHPPDFIERASKVEAWEKQDRAQWRALRRRLEDLGVRGVRLHGGAMLIADVDGPFGSVAIRPGADKRTLAAVRELAEKLKPPKLPFTTDERVLVSFRGLEQRPADVREEEQGTVLRLYPDSNTVEVRLKSLPPGAANTLVTVPLTHVRRLSRAPKQR